MFMIIAVKPKVTINSFAKGNVITLLSPTLFTVFLLSIHANKTNNRNARLQINVNLEKNKTTFMC